MISKYLDINTNHLSKETFDRLNAEKQPYAFHYDNGVFISIPEYKDDPELVDRMPEDLRMLLRYAWRDSDIHLIRMDYDSEIIDELPVYSW